MKEIEKNVVSFLQIQPGASSSDMLAHFDGKYSLATLKRHLLLLVNKQIIKIKGKGKATAYSLSPLFSIVQEIDTDQYFEDEIDQRKIIQHFNMALFENLTQLQCTFISSEEAMLDTLHSQFINKISLLSQFEKEKEMERLAIDLSWKSSQIEGNTYSLLETELLLKESKEAKGKSKLDAIMLLNHKKAIDFVVTHPDFLSPLSVSGIEDIHHILTQDLNIVKGLRTRMVGITGTNFKPIDNEFQIREALQKAVEFVNGKSNSFEKAFWALLLLSYIQPFSDGNKRTARIVSNAILIAENACPLSYRTVDPLYYKMAMLIFYEQNAIAPMKKVFIEQVAFAVKNYF